MSSRGPHTTRRLWAAILSASMIVGACGSNVPRTHASRETAFERPGPGGEESATVDAPTGASAATPSSEVAPGRSTPARSQAAQPTGSREAALRVGPGVHGVTDKVIQLGIGVFSVASLEAGFKAVGAEPPQKDPKLSYRTVIDDMNARGGLAGRKIEPVWHEVDVAQFVNSSTRQQALQQACAHWTEDNSVFAMFAPGFNEDVMLECAAKTKTPFLQVWNQTWPSQRRFSQVSDSWYALDGMVADRLERGFAKFLLAKRFIAADTKVGLLIENKPGIREGVDLGLKPVLAAAGVKPEVEIVYPDIVESPWDNYVLQLQTAGVTHVLMSATSGANWPTTLMMRSAENQRYRPYWLVDSSHEPYTTQERAAAPQEQYAKVRGMGWRPWRDFGDLTVISAADQHCRDLMKKVGQPELASRPMCEVLLFLQAAFERADTISPAGLAAGVGRLGSTYRSISTINGVTQFAPGRHDGSTLVAPIGYDERCGSGAGAPCFRYTGPAERIPE